MDTLSLFMVPFLNITIPTALALIEESVVAQKKKSFFFINANSLNIATRNDQHFTNLRLGDYVFADGMGIRLACKLQGQRLVDNVNGTDLLPHLCQLIEKKNFSVFLLGAKPGIAKKMKYKLEQTYAGINIVGEHHGYFKSQNSQRVIDKINNVKPDIVLVALGSPYQEDWINIHKSQLTTNALIGVGGLFDFASGQIKRAPKFMRKNGLEWVYRLYQEPVRLFKRYIIGNPVFIGKVLLHKHGVEECIGFRK